VSRRSAVARIDPHGELASSRQRSSRQRFGAAEHHGVGVDKHTVVELPTQHCFEINYYYSISLEPARCQARSTDSRVLVLFASGQTPRPGRRPSSSAKTRSRPRRTYVRSTSPIITNYWWCLHGACRPTGACSYCRYTGAVGVLHGVLEQLVRTNLAVFGGVYSLSEIGVPRHRDPDAMRCWEHVLPGHKAIPRIS
jgi:hypothetical protein